MSRPKGSANKVTTEVRELIQAALQEHLEALSDTLEAIDNPKDRLALIVQLLPFIAPKHKAIEIRDTAETFTISFKDPDSL